jgi:hypothetical protein
MLLFFGLYAKCSIHKNIKNKLSEYDSIMLKACELYVDNYVPLYYFGQDTFEMGVFNIIPDSINDYLAECAKNNNFTALKYSYAIILRQYEEIKGRYTTPIVEHFIIFQPNGFIDLFVKAMGKEKYKRKEDETDLGMIYSEPLFFLDFYEWAENNKDKIDDFGYVKRYKRKLKKESKLNK